jgi:hypothetical protein
MLHCCARRIGLFALLVVALLGAPQSRDSALAAIYWQNGDEEIGRSNLDGSNVDAHFITLPTFLGGSNGTLLCGGVAVDGEHVYWADNHHGTIGRANLDGTNANDLFITGASSPCAVSVDSSHIYWANHDSKAIGRAKLDGTAVQQRFIGLQAPPCGLTNSPSHLYWAIDWSSGIGRAAIEGDEATELFLPHAQAGCGIALSPERIYWTNFDGSIGAATTGGEAEEQSLISGLHHPLGLAIHDGRLYWAEQPFSQVGSISRASIDGTNVQRNIVPGIRAPNGVAVDDTVVPPLPETRPEQARLSIVRIKHNRRTGTIVVSFDTSVPGPVTIHVPREIHARLLGVSGDQLAAGRHWVKLSVGPGAWGAWPRDALRRKGWVQFTFLVGFIPAEGASGLRIKELRMWRIRSGR